MAIRAEESTDTNVEENNDTNVSLAQNAKSAILIDASTGKASGCFYDKNYEFASNCRKYRKRNYSLG